MTSVASQVAARHEPTQNGTRSAYSEQDSRGMRRNCIEISVLPKRPGVMAKILSAAIGAPLSLVCWLLAIIAGAPGMGFRWKSTKLAFRVLRQRTRRAWLMAYRLLFWPIDSVRYFEFDFVWGALLNRSV